MSHSQLSNFIISLCEGSGYSSFIVSLCDGFPAAHGSQSAFNHCSLVLMASPIVSIAAVAEVAEVTDTTPEACIVYFNPIY